MTRGRTLVFLPDGRSSGDDCGLLSGLGLLLRPYLSLPEDTMPEILVYPDLEALQAAAAERVAALVAEAVAERGSCLLAISGGSAVPGLFGRLGMEPLRERIPWAALSIIWVDERHVPFDSPDSNCGLAREILLDYMPIPADQVYPVPTYYPLVQAAAIYERQVRALLQIHGGMIDLALLGMGPDGHTASLFPGHPALDAPAEVLVLPIDNAPKPPPGRITLTANALNRSRTAIFLVSGADKAPMLQAALYGPHDPRRIPAQLVQPPAGEVVWMLDTAATTG